MLHEGRLHRLTHDHTLPAEMARRGLIKPEEVETHRLRHVITNVVGGEKAGVHVELVRLRVHDGDRLLLCSDGLTDELSDDVIARGLAAGGVREACEGLVDAALHHGGRDNVTAVVAAFRAV
jgi:protein phosphatase